MAYDYTRSQNSADRLIAKYGPPTGALLLRTTSSGPSYDPTINAPTSFKCKVAIISYTAFELKDSRILSNDKKILMSAKGLTIVPVVTDKIKIGTEIYSIVAPNEGLGIDILAPGGVNVMYTIQCRN